MTPEIIKIENRILNLRSQQVILDRDLAELYGVETRVLNQAVKRNIERFPDEFMFQLTADEFEIWKSQNVMSNSDKMGLRRPPSAVCLYRAGRINAFGGFEKQRGGAN